MQKGDSLLDYTNLFSPNNYENNDSRKVNMKTIYCIKCNKYRKFKISTCRN